MNIRCRILKVLPALILAAAPALALAHPMESSLARPRPSMFHDRSPKLHLHTSFAHH